MTDPRQIMPNRWERLSELPLADEALRHVESDDALRLALTFDPYPDPTGPIKRRWWRLGWLSALAVARDRVAALPSTQPDAGCTCEPEHVWPCDLARCDEPGCEAEVSCGFPIAGGGYRRTCGRHYRGYLPTVEALR